MKKNKPIFIIFALLGFMFTRCSNSVNLNAAYKDISIVYGLLDYQDDTTWIKITKAFAGPGNALTFAKNPDSSNYPYKLNVTLTGRKNGIDLNTINFDTITIHNKEAGDSIFYYPNQLMYFSTKKLDPEAEYNLKIETDTKTITATSTMVQSFHVTYPVRSISFTSDKEITWYSAKNGKSYEVDMVFNYSELQSGNPDTIHKTIKWHLGSKRATLTTGGEQMQIGYSGDGFYKLLQNKLENTPNVERWAGNIDVFVACASQNLDTYIQVNNGTTGLLQEIPQYTNINGGIGLFASRHTVLQSVPMTVASERKLIEDYNLGFKFKQ